MIGQWADHRYTRALPKEMHGRALLHSCCHRPCGKSLIENQCKHGDVSPTKRFKGEQRMIDSTESNPSDEPGHAVIVRCGTGEPTVNVDGPAG